MAAAELPLLIRDTQYPCLGARAAAQRGTAAHQSFSSLRDPSEIDALADALRKFSDDSGHDGEPRSFIAIYPRDSHADAREFECSLWQLLADLHARDREAWPTHAPRVPGARDFRYFFAGHPWFIVGMSPVLDRPSRQSSVPAFAFNPSAMFDRLRASGRYDRFAAAVKARDFRFSGTSYLGPVRYPDLGDAPQYAGQEFSDSWRCPLPVQFGSPDGFTFSDSVPMIERNC